MRLLTSALVASALFLTAAGCGQGGSSSADAELRVVATTQHLGDFARAVGGPRVAVEVLMGPNVDPHDFEPRPSDARAVADADIVLESGGDIDAWLEDVIAGAGGDARRVTLIDAVETIEGGHEHHGEDEHDEEAGHEEEAEVDPHWWQDPRNVVRATDRIRATFAEADPAGSSAYDENARAYAEKVERLDTAIARCMRQIPDDRRKLVTGHDAFGYFAARYDIEILGSILPALSSSAQPSAGDVRRLVDAMKAEDVRVVFPETALNERLADAVARDAGAEVGPILYADALGAEGSEGATYLGALRHDARAIVTGFGASCDL